MTLPTTAIIDGKSVAAALQEELQLEVERLRLEQQNGLVPGFCRLGNGLKAPRSTCA
jgi:hypothetical protein